MPKRGSKYTDGVGMLGGAGGGNKNDISAVAFRGFMVFSLDGEGAWSP